MFEVELTLASVPSHFAPSFLLAQMVLGPMTGGPDLVIFPKFERSLAFGGGRGVDPPATAHPSICVGDATWCLGLHFRSRSSISS